MKTLLITLADFPAYVPFSVNIGAQLVDPHIRDAQQFDVWPLLPEVLRIELQTDRAAWQPNTVTLFEEKIKPLLVCEAAARMLLWHGTHITPNGLEELASDLTRTAASSKRRAELSADVQQRAAHYRPLLLAALPRPAGSCGSPAARRPSRGGFRAVAV